MKADNLDFVKVCTTAEILKIVRHNYSKPTGRTTRGDKINSRSLDQFGYVTKPCPDNFEKRYRHFKESQQCGHFTPSFIPYKTLGNLVLESNQLFVENFRDSLPSWLKSNKPNDGATPVEGTESKSQEKATVPSSKQISKSNGKDSESNDDAVIDFKGRNKATHRAGLSHIKTLLNETEKRRTAVKAGQPYIRHAQECQRQREIKKRLREEAEINPNQMDLHRLSSHTLHEALSTKGIPTKQEMEEASVGKSMEDQSDGTSIIFARKSFYADKDSSTPPPGQRINRKQQAYVDKVDYIYLVLCSLCNMKSRYLKSKQTLSYETIKALRRDPFAKREEDASLTARSLTRRDTVGSRIDVNLLQKQRTSSIGKRKSSTGFNSLIGVTTGRPPSGFSTNSKISSTVQSPQPKARTRTGNRLILLLKDSKMTHEAPVQLETWEDLINIGTKNKLLRMLRKHLPLWQQPIPESPTVPVTRAGSPDDVLEDYDVEELVHNMKVDHVAIKEKAQRQCKHELDKIDRERIIKFRYKLNTLEDVPFLFDEHQYFLYRVTKEAIKDPELITEHSVPWFEMLVEEATQLGIRDDIRVEEALGKLEKFILEDLDSIIHIKEKLCLFVMSLPIYEVLKPHVQHALKFVMSDMLPINPDMLKEWLSHRKLYSMTD